MMFLRISSIILAKDVRPFHGKDREKTEYVFGGWCGSSQRGPRSRRSSGLIFSGERSIRKAVRKDSVSCGVLVSVSQ